MTKVSLEERQQPQKRLTLDPSLCGAVQDFRSKKWLNYYVLVDLLWGYWLALYLTPSTISI